MKKIFPLWYFAIFLIPVIVNPFGISLYGQVKISWFLFCISLTFFTLAFIIFRKKSFSFSYNKSLLIYLAIYAFSLLFSTLFSETPLLSFFGEYEYMRGIIFYALIIFHFFLCLQIFQKEKYIRFFFIFTKFLGIGISIHAILQYFNIDPFIDVDNAKYLFRVYGTLGQPNFLGQFLIFPFFITLFSLKESYHRKINKHFFFDISLFCIISLALFLTQNRASFLAISITLLICFCTFSSYTKFKKIGITALLTTVPISAMLYFGINTRSLYSRWLLWESVFKNISFQNFFLGNGLNSFYRTIASVLPKTAFEYETFYTLPARVHNEFLENFLETGLVGAILYLVPIFFLVIILYKKKLNTLNAQISFSVILAYIFSVQMSFGVIEHFVFLAGFWAILLLQTLSFKQIHIHLSSIFKRLSIAVVCGVLGIFLFFSAYSILRTDILLNKGMKQYFKNLHESYTIFNKASSLSPFFSTPHKLILDFFIAPYTQGDPFFHEKLKTHLDTYEKIHNQDFYFHILSIKFASWKKNIPQVKSHAKKATALAPNIPLVYTEAGNAFFANNDCKNALIYYQKLESLAPKSAFFQNSSNLQEKELHRLFIKHAKAFENAMTNKNKCKRNKPTYNK